MGISIDKLKTIIIDISIISFFILFLLFIVSYFQDSDFDYNKIQNEKTIIFSEGSKSMLKYKFDVISNMIIYNLNSTQIDEMNSPYFNYLIVNNMIHNKYNSIGQEIIYNYENNKLFISKNISKELLLIIYDSMDSEDEQRWRNSILILKDGNNSIELYKHLNLLLNFNESNISVEKKINISTYSHQIYNFTFFNNSNKIIKINLDKNEKKELRNELDEFIITNKNNLLNSSISFEYNNKSYEFIYKIWK